jgi:hypothetical protein
LTRLTVKARTRHPSQPLKASTAAAVVVWNLRYIVFPLWFGFAPILANNSILLGAGRHLLGAGSREYALRGTRFLDGNEGKPRGNSTRRRFGHHLAKGGMADDAALGRTAGQIGSARRTDVGRCCARGVRPTTCKRWGQMIGPREPGSLSPRQHPTKGTVDDLPAGLKLRSRSENHHQPVLISILSGAPQR